MFYLLFASAVAFVAPLSICPNVTYNRWDNYEYFTPIINHVHSVLLHGQIPGINPHQHMGEPIQSNVQAGLFYIPYTLSVAIQKIVGLRLDTLQTVIVAIHLPICMIGIYLLLRWICIRPWLGAVGAVSTSCTGFAMAHATVWAFALPNITWLAWIILGSMMVMQRRRPLIGGCLVALGIPLVASIGHGQITCYAFLYLILVIGLAGVIYFKSILSIFRLTPFVIVGILLSAPAVLPIVLFIPQTTRSAEFTREQFFEASASPASFLGLISPLFEISNGFMSDRKSSLFLYQGAHVLPLIGAFLLIGFVLFKRRRVEAAELSDDSFRLFRFGLIILIVTILFMLFAIGPKGIIYGWTYGIPVWSSFRWPYKFLLFAMWGLGVVSWIGAELLLRHPETVQRTRLILPTTCLLAMLIGLMWRRSELLTSLPGMIALATGVTTLLLLSHFHKSWIPRAFIPVMLLSTLGTVALVQNLNLKPHKIPYGVYTADKLGLDPAYRVMTLFEGASAEECGLYHMATVHGYSSLTGCTQPFVPGLFTYWIPSKIHGLADIQWAFTVLDTHYLRSMNVRYLIGATDRGNAIVASSADGDKTALTLLNNARFHPIKKVGAITVYATDDALPKAYFASQVFGWSTAAMSKGMMDNQSAIDAAYVDGIVGEYPNVPRGKILREQWEENGSVTLDIDASQTGFLVLSLLHLPDWQAWVDGQPATIRLVNGIIMGLEIPAGAKQVQFRYIPRGLNTGLALAAAGLILLIAWSGGVHWLRRKRNSSIIPEAPR